MATKIVRNDKYHVTKIIGNSHIRDLLDILEVEAAGYEIPDWIDPEDYDFGYQFFVYKNELYCTADFTRVEKHAPEWMQEYDGYANNSFFSGIVIKWAEIPDSYGEMGLKVYTYISGIWNEQE